LNEKDVEQLHDFEEECMEIYYREKEAKQAAMPDERLRLMTDRLVHFRI